MMEREARLRRDLAAAESRARAAEEQADRSAASLGSCGQMWSAIAQGTHGSPKAAARGNGAYCSAAGAPSDDATAEASGAAAGWERRAGASLVRSANEHGGEQPVAVGLSSLAAGADPALRAYVPRGTEGNGEKWSSSATLEPVNESSDDELESHSFSKAHGQSPVASPKVAPRRIDPLLAQALNAGALVIPPYKPSQLSNTSRKRGSGSEGESTSTPTSPVATHDNGSTSSGPASVSHAGGGGGGGGMQFKRAGQRASLPPAAAAPAAASAGDTPSVPGTPSTGFRRRLGGGLSRSEKLAGLSAVAGGVPSVNGVTPGQGMLSRKVYHSVGW